MKKLLIVVDFQNDFVDGSLGFDGASNLEPKIMNKIKEYKLSNNDVIFTMDTHDKNYLETFEGKNIPVPHCIKGTNGWWLYGNVDDFWGQNELVLPKKTFASLDLANYLVDKEYESIEIIGLVSNLCVISNAIMVQSALPDTQIIVDASCTASFDNILHEKALDIMEGMFIKVINR